MLPTMRDVEVQAEIRKTRLREADQMRLFRQVDGAQRQEPDVFARFLVGLGTWMMNAGEELRTRYGKTQSLEPELHSLQQGC